MSIFVPPPPLQFFAIPIASGMTAVHRNDGITTVKMVLARTLITKARKATAIDF